MFARARRAAGVAVLLGASAVAVTGSPAAAATFTPGSAGLGDPYFPHLGNGGYDVEHYTLNLAYDPSSHRLRGRAYITARATKNLSKFVLDFDGMTVRGATVNARGAYRYRSGAQLVITPQSGLVQGSTFRTVIAYDGVPQTITNSPLAFGGDYGWVYTNDGALVVDEPNGAHTWFPCNDHPRDKATFTLRMSVPSSKQVVANGELVSRRTTNGRTEWTWDETKPMATYLATVDIGDWTFDGSYTDRGIRSLLAFDPSIEQAVRNRAVGIQTREITDYWAYKLGGYPFQATGAIVDDAPELGFALETQTRPVYGLAPDKYTISHELAHQWFGDSVSTDVWRAIWLNEGFATFFEWYWSYERTDSSSTYAHARSIYDGVPSSDALWHLKVADPGRDTMFANAVYTRGGMTLAALRHLIGSTKFWQLMRTWATSHRYSTATTPEFIALAERISGRDLTRFFDAWIYSTSKPSSFGVH